MRIAIDATRCDGYGTCFDVCPSAFESDDWGYAAVRGDGTVPAGDEPKALRAISLCAENAVRQIG
ncbi:ferredoxin [Rhodococcus sp. HNM0563]|uniref:ferredoxin n=1 Tax=unclassified Rhodococcus (in: high G+C Gram-positive bacteria) TaxID=192944 RepID=UPI00146A0277|nr:MULTISPECIES: ferredoxin [unclassified Rhodococcus (in: high G+C Gram-positive bacteria)]MCK0089458.1 ferredoxin [Rhodococcus sp. F64268]NLU62987.1 ferredoxin [Rhodococcus sp. HNM0563]